MVEIPNEILESIMSLVCVSQPKPSDPSFSQQRQNRKDAKTTLGSCRLVSKQFLAAANHFYPQYVTLVLDWDTDVAADPILGRLNELLASPLSTIEYLLQSVTLTRQHWFEWEEPETNMGERLLSYIDRLPNVKQLVIGVEWTDACIKRWSPLIQNLKTRLTSLKWTTSFSSAAGLINATVAVASPELDRFELWRVDFSDRKAIPLTGGEHGSQILSQTNYFRFYDATSHVIPAVFEAVICMGGRFKEMDLVFEDCNMYPQEWRSVERLLKQCGSRLEHLTLNMGHSGPLASISLSANASIRTFNLVLTSFNELTLPLEIINMISSIGSRTLKNISVDMDIWSDGFVERILAIGFDSLENALLEKFGVSKLPNTILTIRPPREARTNSRPNGMQESGEDLAAQVREKMPEMLKREKLDIQILNN